MFIASIISGYTGFKGKHDPFLIQHRTRLFQSFLMNLRGNTNLKGDHYLAKDGMKGVFGKAVDVDWIPRYLILDKNGKIVLYRAIETDFEKINSTLKKLK